MEAPWVSHFKDIKLGDPIEVVEMVRSFKEDPHPDKVNCSIGGYLNTETNEIHLFNAVKKAEQDLANDPYLHHAYLPTLGYPDVNKKAVGLLLGDKHPALKGKNCTVVSKSAFLFQAYEKQKYNFNL